MPGFDAVLIGATGGVVCVFIGLIADWNGGKGRSGRLLTALAVGMAFIAMICSLALKLNWESDILVLVVPGCFEENPTTAEPACSPEAEFPEEVPEPAPAVAPAQETTAPPNIPADRDMVCVPQVVGMEQNEAVELLSNCGLTFQVFWTVENNVSGGRDYVISQSIPGGRMVPRGTEVRLELSLICSFCETPAGKSPAGVLRDRRVCYRCQISSLYCAIVRSEEK